MKIHFLQAAAMELEEAVSYYNLQSEGLGFELAAEIQRTLKRIDEYPQAWTRFSHRTHRCRTNRFPYCIIYQIRLDMMLIVAIMHLHKEPGYWKSRITQNKK
jgi:hypothetical protein